MATKSAGSGVNGRARTPKSGSNSNSSNSNNTRSSGRMNSASNYTSGSGQMSGGENTSSNRSVRSNSVQTAQTAQTGGSLGMISGPRMGMSQNSGGTSVSQNASANKLVGRSQNSGGTSVSQNASANKLVGRSQNSGGTSFQTGVSQNASANKLVGKSQNSGGTSFQTGINQNALALKRAGNAAIQRQRNTLAAAAESRRENEKIVSSNLLKQFKQNVKNLETNIPRNIGSKISNILKSKVTVQNFVVLEKLLENARKAAKAKVEREAAAEAARKKARKNAMKAKKMRTPVKSTRGRSSSSSRQMMISAAKQKQDKGRQEKLTATRMTNTVSQKNFDRVPIATMKQILINRGKPSNLGKTRKQPYIQALINMGLTKQELKTQTPITPRTATSKRKRNATPSGRSPKIMKTATSKTPRTAARGAAAFLAEKQKQKQKLVNNVNKRTNLSNIQKNTLLKIINRLNIKNLNSFNINREIKNMTRKELVNNVKRRTNLSNIQKNTLLKIINRLNIKNLTSFNINREINLNATRKELDRMVSDSNLNSREKKRLSNRIMSESNLNKLRQDINVILNPEVAGYNSKKSKAQALIKLYKSKITVRDRITNTMEKTMVDEITKFNITTGRMSMVSEITSETFLNLLLIMWLDGIHDKYIIMTFKKWLASPNIKSTFPPATYDTSDMFTFLQNLRVKPITKYKANTATTSIDNRLQLFIEGERLKNNYHPQLGVVLNGFLKWIADKEKIILTKPGSKSTFTERFINNLGFKSDANFVPFSAGWEKDFKKFLVEKYASTNNIIQNVKKIKAKNDDIFLLAIDQEYSTRQERALTNMIINSGKSVQSLVTYGQAFDPGSTMLPEGIVPDLQNITVKVLNPESQKLEDQKYILSPTPWYYLEDFKFTMNVNGSPVMEVKFNTQTSNLTLNGKTLSLSITAGKAGKSNDPFFQLGKYFGDGLQYFIASALTKSKPVDIQLEGNNKKTAFHSFLGSGDGMALFGYDFVCTRLYKARAPNMVIDFSGQSNPIAHIVNFPSELFTVEQVSKVERQPIGNRKYDTKRETEVAQTSTNGSQGGNNGNTVNQT